MLVGEGTVYFAEFSSIEDIVENDPAPIMEQS